MTMKRFLTACALALLTTTAFAQDKPVSLRISHWVPASHPLQKTLEMWLAGVTKSSGGSITGTIFPAQQLGKAFDHYDMARDGIADVTYINPGYQPGRFPVIAAGELPFLMNDGVNSSKALDEWYRPYAAKEMKDVKYCLAFVHDPGGLHMRDKKVTVPADIKGLKIRPAHATMASFMTSLGATNIQAGAPEVRDALEKGVADGVTFPWGSTILFGVDKVTKFHMDVPFYVTTFVYAINLNTYNAMSANQKKAIDDNCNADMAQKVGATWAGFEADGRAKMRADTTQDVYKITDAQVGEWKAAAAPLQAKWAEAVGKAGVNATEAYAGLQAALKKNNAAY
jgi:TRAP-type C4-dicarboxylate transport system substrate-binding protein